MLSSKTLLFGLVQFFTAVHCKNIKVLVGQNGNITFSPNTVKALPGDTVTFLFAGLNHTVTSGNPLLGCQPDGLLNSGFVPVTAPAQSQKRDALDASNADEAHASWFPPPPPQQVPDDTDGLPSFTVPILDVRPRMLYCAQALHCQNGMVMVINPTQRGSTSLARYQRLSAQAETNVAPPEVVGGFLRNAPGAVAGWQVVRKNAASPSS